jgi:hypothetical protein
MNKKFDDIRPYFDTELPAAMARIADSEYFSVLSKFVFPNKDISEVQQMIRNYTNTDDFQRETMCEFNRQTVVQTTDGLTYSGMEYLDASKAYLFVSNHRDIVLDSSLLQYILIKEGLNTTDITFGSNLMSSQLIIDIGRSNKMFKVSRGETPREFYKTSLHISEYIRHAIVERKQSIWIAQRSGRTKDGNDLTDQGLIKMFCMSDKKDVAKGLEELNIVPVAVSFQYEPCEYFKTREIYSSQKGIKYVKEKDEDVKSVLLGITQFKGKVHISICPPIKSKELSNSSGENFHKHVANIINRRIYDDYKLFNTNYIAYDIRSCINTYNDYYTQDEKEAFVERCNKIIDKFDTDKNVVRDIIIGIYANAVSNKIQL